MYWTFLQTFKHYIRKIVAQFELNILDINKHFEILELNIKVYGSFLMPGKFLPLVYLSDIIHYSVEHKIIFNVFVKFLSLPKEGVGLGLITERSPYRKLQIYFFRRDIRWLTIYFAHFILLASLTKFGCRATWWRGLW